MRLMSQGPTSASTSWFTSTRRPPSAAANAVGILGLPLGLGLNFVVNGRDDLIPMAVEEPSVVAAVSFAAKTAREGNGFLASADEPLMVAQVQLTDYGDPVLAKEKILGAKDEILALANSFQPAMQRRGGGAKDLEVRILEAPEGPPGRAHLRRAPAARRARRHGREPGQHRRRGNRAAH
jgi:degradative hydroxymethylglutaryl-CoA reductase